MSLSASFELGSAGRICTNFMVESQSQMERSRATSLWVVWKSVLRSVRFRSANVFQSIYDVLWEMLLCQNGLSARCNHHYCFGYQPPVGVDDGGKEFRGSGGTSASSCKRKATLVSLPSDLSIETALLLEIISRRAFVRILPRFVAKGSRW